MIHKQMVEYGKAMFASGFVVANTLIQWLSNADTALKLLATIIALPTAVFTGKFMYYQQRLKRLEMIKLERELTDSEP